MWTEIAVGPVSVRSNEVVTAIKCDLRRELAWVGCESGYVFVMHRQMGEVIRYSSWRAHPTRVVGLLPLGSHMLSLASNRVAMHSAGGLLQFASTTKDGLDIRCGLLEAGQGLTRLLIGGASSHSGVVANFDLVAHEEVGRYDVGEASPVVGLKGPVSRGWLALSTANGQLCVADPRSKMGVVHKLAAHPGGIRSMDARGDLIATVGCALRLGEVVVDNVVKVFDVRGALRPILTLPASNPRLLQFQPRRNSTVMVASAGGIITFTDVQNAASMETYQVNLSGYGGDGVVAADISSSGDIAVLGGGEGSVHIWCNSTQASMNLASEPLEIVPVYPPRRCRPLSEQDSFASLPLVFSHDPWLLSEVDPSCMIDVGLPPHVVEPTLLKDMNQVDFVGYIPNPYYSRGLPPLAATRSVAHLRNARLQLGTITKKGQEALKAERALARAAAGGSVLPMRYQRMEIKVQTGVKFEEFDFSYYNRTCFAGLENGLRNCYVNSLLQVLYFVPMFRKSILSHIPEPEVEFCLTCEMSFLFRMLRSANGTPCQAANLLRTLKQIPEATALGLLEGSAGPGQDSPQTSSLPRLLSSLTRFLLDHLNKESGASQTGVARLNRTPPPGGWEGVSSIDTIFGLRYRQRVQCRDTNLPEKIREASNFQVDLVVPSSDNSSSWPVTPERSMKRYFRNDLARDNSILKDAPLTPPGTTLPNKSYPPAPWDGRPHSAGDAISHFSPLASFPQPPLSSVPQTPLSQPSSQPSSCPTTHSTPPPGNPTPSSVTRTPSSQSWHTPPAPDQSPRPPDPPSTDSTPRACQHPTPPDVSHPTSSGPPFRPDLLDVSATHHHSHSLSPRANLFPSGTSPGRTPLHSPLDQRWAKGGFGPPPREGSGEGVSGTAASTQFQAFSELLQASLQQANETRAWFPETRSYHRVTQSRVPLKMPQVLVVNCSNADPSQLQRWMDGPSPEPGKPSWLPPAIAVDFTPDDWQVNVQEADSSSELQHDPPSGTQRVVYELTALVCHVQDADDIIDPASTTPAGHLIAHIKVLPPYVIEQQELASIWSRPHQHALSSYKKPEVQFRGRGGSGGSGRPGALTPHTGTTPVTPGHTSTFTHSPSVYTPPSTIVTPASHAVTTPTTASVSTSITPHCSAAKNLAIRTSAGPCTPTSASGTSVVSSVASTKDVGISTATISAPQHPNRTSPASVPSPPLAAAAFFSNPIHPSQASNATAQIAPVWTSTTRSPPPPESTNAELTSADAATTTVDAETASMGTGATMVLDSVPQDGAAARSFAERSNRLVAPAGGTDPTVPESGMGDETESGAGEIAAAGRTEAVIADLSTSDGQQHAESEVLSSSAAHDAGSRPTAEMDPSSLQDAGSEPEGTETPASWECGSAAAGSTGAPGSSAGTEMGSTGAPGSSAGTEMGSTVDRVRSAEASETPPCDIAGIEGANVGSASADACGTGAGSTNTDVCGTGAGSTSADACGTGAGSTSADGCSTRAGAGSKGASADSADTAGASPAVSCTVRSSVVPSAHSGRGEGKNTTGARLSEDGVLFLEEPLLNVSRSTDYLPTTLTPCLEVMLSPRCPPAKDHMTKGHAPPTTDTSVHDAECATDGQSTGGVSDNDRENIPPASPPPTGSLPVGSTESAGPHEAESAARSELAEPATSNGAHRSPLSRTSPATESARTADTPSTSADVAMSASSLSHIATSASHAASTHTHLGSECHSHADVNPAHAVTDHGSLPSPLTPHQPTGPRSATSPPFVPPSRAPFTPLTFTPNIHPHMGSGPSSQSQGGGSWTPLPSPASAQAMTSAINAALTAPASKTQETYSDWLVFNDFCISPCPFSEVMDHCDGQKLPVLLFYTQVEELEAAEDEQLSTPVPVLTRDMFHALCHAEPLQGPNANIVPRPITPFDVRTTPPRPGMLLALDAEFVALSAPMIQIAGDGSEVQVKQPRLGLARVSVLYGEGELAGEPCIDDYIRTLEPVYDYLTRFSGLEAGDLDPSSSPHPLCTLKAAYLKLRYLVDSGCVFVGHGLKKDFRTINIVVPPSQIIDTVELFSFRKQRKLSLRFLASYMLGVTIQEETHDSVEDARTALQLYQLYRQLESEGRVVEVLTGIYQWGKQHGWDPVHRSINGGTMHMPSPSNAMLLSHLGLAGGMLGRGR